MAALLELDFLENIRVVFILSGYCSLGEEFSSARSRHCGEDGAAGGELCEYGSTAGEVWAQLSQRLHQMEGKVFHVIRVRCSAALSPRRFA